MKGLKGELYVLTRATAQLPRDSFLFACLVGLVFVFLFVFYFVLLCREGFEGGGQMWGGEGEGDGEMGRIRMYDVKITKINKI